MSFELIGFSIIGSIIFSIIWLAVVSVRAHREEVEETAWGEASRYRRHLEQEERE
jgi:hypothetical protein